jgi:gamma-glutamyltranspeptidase / glutathione hydrolase
MLRGFTPQAALDAPRFCISAGMPDTQTQESGQAGDINSEVYIEEGIAESVIQELGGMKELSYPLISLFMNGE